MSHYGFSVTLSGQMDEIVERVTEALKAESFGIITTIDIQAVFKNKLDVEHRPYRILGACNPNLARQAISNDPDVGLLLPCNVLVREEENGEITVSFMDPEVILDLVDNEAIKTLGLSVKEQLKRVQTALSQ